MEWFAFWRKHTEQAFRIYFYQREMVRMRMPALPKDKREPKRSYFKILKEKLFKRKKRRPFIKVPERK